MGIFRKFGETIQDSLKSDNNTGTSHADQYKSLTIFRSILLKMRNVSDIFLDKIKTHFEFNNFFPFMEKYGKIL